MNNFLLELWHDLKAKRLWPVAFLLVIGLIAVPLVLRKPSEEPAGDANSTSAPVSDQPATKAGVVLAADNKYDSSRLEAFGNKNPFTSLVRHRSSSSSTSSSSSSTELSGGSLGGGESTGSTGGSGGSVGTSPITPPSSSPHVTLFTYVADVTFGRVGHVKRITGLRKLQMLPNSDNPLLVFLGVDGRGDAVFLRDATLQQTGEGHCVDHACSVLSIGSGNEHLFTDKNGNEYFLRIDEVRRVKAASVAKASAARTPVAHASVGNHARRADDDALGVVSSLLVDVQAVASTEAGSSSAGHQDR
jgi:hypothetical protein